MDGAEEKKGIEIATKEDLIKLITDLTNRVDALTPKAEEPKAEETAQEEETDDDELDKLIGGL